MKQYVLGVDGGGTKTQCALYDIEGNEVDLINWGPTNHEVLKGGYQGFKSEMTLMLNYLVKRNGLQTSQIVKSVFGMAGVDTRWQHKVISGVLKELGFNDFKLYNDAYLAIKAGSKNGWGIGVVNGTGCSVAGIDRTGGVLQVGGMGAITGDLGGGAYLGEKFIQSVYNYYFRCGAETCMLDMIPEELKVESKYDFIDNAIRKIEEGSISVRELNRIIFDAANKGDNLAIKILEELGRSLANSVNGCIRELKFDTPGLQVILSGSINTKAANPTITDTLKECVTSANRDMAIEFILLDKPPVVGAVIWALEDIMDREQIIGLFMKY